MAHEIKNSLTPIRLTMEEIGVRFASQDTGFLQQATQIVVDEVTRVLNGASAPLPNSAASLRCARAPSISISCSRNASLS